jgi:uncharacterized MAPEG superfamily protein
MTVALWCVLVAALFPLVCSAIAKGAYKDYDNSKPREWLARQQGWRARANAAQQNSWEALIVFAAAVFAAHLAGAPQDKANAIAIAFLVARVVYVFFYLADRPTLRSATWLIAFGLCVALFVIGA